MSKSIPNVNHILLTTFPIHKSKNVGDSLITASTMKLIKKRKFDYHPLIKFREENLDGFSKKNIQFLVAPGFSVANNVYPDLYKLYSDIQRMRYFFPIGSSFQHIIPSREAFMESEYNNETLIFLKYITEKFGPIPCRDMLIVEMLNDRFNIPAYYSGDIALFDEDIINSKFNPPGNINSLVFTIQHHPRYEQQSLDLLKKIYEQFYESERYISFHSKPSPYSLRIANHAKENYGFKLLNLSGPSTNLKAYDDIDLHIGYRLHGHIYFLRSRKPSILMIEDARSFGLANTKGTDFGCINAFSTDSMTVTENAPQHAIEFLNQQIQENFKGYQYVFNFIDKTFKETVSPYMDRIVNAMPDYPLD